MEGLEKYIAVFEAAGNFLERNAKVINTVLSVLWILFFEAWYFTGAEEGRPLFVILLALVGAGFGFLSYQLLMLSIWVTGLGGVVAFVIAVIGAIIYGTYKLIEFLYITIIWTHAI